MSAEISDIHYSDFDKLFRYAERLKFGDTHFKIDHDTGLVAIVAIHNTKLGPGFGGCRFITYPNMAAAVEDVLRLAYMMTCKAAVCQLPLGGAKSVIIRPKKLLDREALFASFGDFVQSLGGRYVAALDSGTVVEDMNTIARRTAFVSCTSSQLFDGDPAPYTALGVLRGIEAAVKFKLNKNHLKGIHVTIQGAGHVGQALARLLADKGAILTLSDINQAAAEKLALELKANIVSSDDIYSVECDVFSPCALGHILTQVNIDRLRCKIVAGSANNELAHAQLGYRLQQRGILYAPDFVINAGGLIHAGTVYLKGNAADSQQKIMSLYDRNYEIFERSLKENLPTNEIAEIIAMENLNKAPARPDNLSGIVDKAG